MVQSSLFSQINRENIPEHIAVIMDGNGRWAEERGLSRSEGHIAGVESVRCLLKASTKLGIKVLTLYTFSEENWRRPKDEVEALMCLLVASIQREMKQLIENRIKLNVIGEIQSLPEKAKEALLDAINKTEHFETFNLVLAINYSSKREILRASSRLPKKDKYTEEEFRKYFYQPNLSDPDLLIRTGGEQRISNFLLWQLAYTELYFTSTYWPDFQEEDLYRAVLDYQRRQRRYGKTGAQILDLNKNK